MAVKVSINIGFGYISDDVYSKIKTINYIGLDDSFAIIVDFYESELSRQKAVEIENAKALLNDPVEFNKLDDVAKAEVEYNARCEVLIPRTSRYYGALVLTEFNKDILLTKGYEYLATLDDFAGGVPC